VLEYQVTGNTLLQAIDIERLLYPLLGEDKTAEDVEAARTALETLYRDRGYGTMFVDVPEQSVDDGVIELQVTEGKLERLRVTGARLTSNRRILAALPSLQSGQTPHLPSLQRELSALNATSRDLEVTPVMKAGTTPGTVDMDLKVKDKLPLHGSAELNDRYSANTTRSRLALAVAYEDLFQRRHSLSLAYQGTPENLQEIRVLSATYLAPFASGNLLAAYVVDTNSDFAAAGSSASPLGILGTGRIYGLRHVMRAGATHSITLGADYKDFVDSIALPGGSTDRTPIRYLGWTVGYGGRWQAPAADRQRQTTLNVSTNFGLRGVVNDPATFDYKRYNARPNYLHLRADMTHYQPLRGGSALALRAAGQWTADPLISNEQFAIGGADSVRGYLESEALGDLGATASLEWRAPAPVNLLGDWAESAQMHLFADMGVVHILDPLPDAQDRRVRAKQLASLGLGLRVAGPAGLQGALDWAYPLLDGDYSSTGDARLQMQLKYGF
jgi:hemolysin activation/secretion protein